MATLTQRLNGAADGMRRLNEETRTNNVLNEQAQTSLLNPGQPTGLLDVLVQALQTAQASGQAAAPAAGPPPETFESQLERGD